MEEIEYQKSDAIQNLICSVNRYIEYQKYQFDRESTGQRLLCQEFPLSQKCTKTRQKRIKSVDNNTSVFTNSTIVIQKKSRNQSEYITNTSTGFSSAFPHSGIFNFVLQTFLLQSHLNLNMMDYDRVNIRQIRYNDSSRVFLLNSTMNY